MFTMTAVEGFLNPVLHGGLAPAGLDREKINEPLHHMPESRSAGSHRTLRLPFPGIKPSTM